MTLQEHQVLQRDADGLARVTTDAGRTVELSAGGPHDVDGVNVLVGDLWVLAGQSNMEGVGDLADVEPPHPRVHSFQSREQWAPAEEPLHWLGESPRAVHHAINGQPMPRSTPPRDPNRLKGSGLGLAFARALVEADGVPVGLIPAAHGGTSMQQWDPARKGQGGGSLYGATLERVRAVGGKVAGILWYQGESDANPADAPLYTARMTDLVRSFRADLSRPALPFYFVQLGPFVQDPSTEGVDGWNAVREAQRLLSRSLPDVGMASAIDLGLDDAIHIDTAGLRALGRRLARIALGHPAPALAGAAWDRDLNRLRVSFANVEGCLQATGRPAGFSLRDAAGAEKSLIYKTTLDGADAVVRLNEAFHPAGLFLWYGHGFDPYCNITDESGASLPTFGPLPLG
jgi:hypothetical protein